MPYRKRKNGGVIADRLTSMELTSFYAEHRNRNIGAGVTARMMNAGGGKVTVYALAREQQAQEQQQAQRGAGDPVRLPSGDAEPALDRAKFWRPGFG